MARKKNPVSSCPVPGCEKKVKTKGLCNAHYVKALRLHLAVNDFKALSKDHRANNGANQHPQGKLKPKKVKLPGRGRKAAKVTLAKASVATQKPGKQEAPLTVAFLNKRVGILETKGREDRNNYLSLLTAHLELKERVTALEVGAGHSNEQLHQLVITQGEFKDFRKNSMELNLANTERFAVLEKRLESANDLLKSLVDRLVKDGVGAPFITGGTDFSKQPFVSLAPVDPAAAKHGLDMQEEARQQKEPSLTDSIEAERLRRAGWHEVGNGDWARNRHAVVHFSQAEALKQLRRDEEFEGAGAARDADMPPPPAT